MAITFTPKIGAVLECDFGVFAEDAIPKITPIYNGSISPEIRKRRLVTVLSNKTASFIVVPISSSQALDRRFHVELPQGSIPRTHFYDDRTRWVITNCISHVSRERLFKVSAFNNLHLDRAIVTEIQKKVIYSISALALITP